MIYYYLKRDENAFSLRIQDDKLFCGKFVTDESLITIRKVKKR